MQWTHPKESRTIYFTSLPEKAYLRNYKRHIFYISRLELDQVLYFIIEFPILPLDFTLISLRGKKRKKIIFFLSLEYRTNLPCKYL